MKSNKETMDLPSAFAENLKFIHQENYSLEDIQKLFTSSDTIKSINIGDVNFTTGKIVVADPLCYLQDEEFSKPLNYVIEPGHYPVYLSIFCSDAAGLRIAAAKLEIREEPAVRYEIAMPYGTTIEQYNKPGILAGFSVDAGMACFCDEQTAKEYAEFLTKWKQQNPEGNHYDDYFAQFFAKSYRRFPAVQRESGDFIIWANPDTANRTAMFASGLGDGFYQSLWGFNKNNQVCELVIPFMNPELF